MNGSKNVVGIDIAKRVFQLHWIDMETGEIVSLQLKRDKFLEHFANRQQCLIGMEACGGAQHWARKLTAMGHQVKLLPGKAVKGSVTATDLKGSVMPNPAHIFSNPAVLSALASQWHKNIDAPPVTHFSDGRYLSPGEMMAFLLAARSDPLRGCAALLTCSLLTGRELRFSVISG